MGESFAVQGDQIAVASGQAIQSDSPGLLRLLHDFEDYAYLNNPDYVLVVDDVFSNFQTVRNSVRRLWPTWAESLQWAKNSDEAREFLHKSVGTKSSMSPPKLVAANLSVPDGKGQHGTALALARYVRDNFGGVHIALYGSVTIEDEVVEYILGIRANYLQLGDPESLLILALNLPLLSRGFMIFSPAVSAQIPTVLHPGKPDPLSSREWAFVAEVATSALTLEKLAPKMGYSVPRINQKCKEIAYKLRDARFFELDADRTSRPGQYRDKLEAFYKKWHAHYERP